MTGISHFKAMSYLFSDYAKTQLSTLYHTTRYWLVTAANLLLPASTDL